MSNGATARGGRGRCRACASDRQAEIDDALAAEVPYRRLERRFGISKTALVNHKRNHLTPALIALRKERTALGASTLTERLGSLVDDAQSILDAAFASKNASLGLHAIRELRSTLELVARVTGELDERPAVTVNLQTSPEWTRIRAIVMEFVPTERRAELARRLQLLEEPGHDVN
jgi:hypothetical protein